MVTPTNPLTIDGNPTIFHEEAWDRNPTLTVSRTALGLNLPTIMKLNNNNAQIGQKMMQMSFLLYQARNP